MTEMFKYTREERGAKKEEKEMIYIPDDIEKRILNILQQDARTTVKEMSELLHLPKTTIYYRIKKLEKQNVIEGYHAKVNTEKLGIDFDMIINIRATYSKGYDDKITESLYKIPGVWAIFSVFGDSDYVVLARGKSRRDLVQKIQSVMSLEDVEKTSTSIVASTLKLDQREFFDFTKYSDFKYSDVKFSNEFDRMKILGTAAEPKFKVRTFSHWDEVLPYDYIPPSSKPYFFSKYVIPFNVNYAYKGVLRSLDEYIIDNAIAGLMVLRDGEIIFEEYRYGLDSESRYHLWGAAKSFTGTIVGMALHDGDIKSLDDLTKDYAPQFKGTAYGDVSIRHLLMMSSGVNFFRNQGSPNRRDMFHQIWGGDRDLDDFSAELSFRAAPGTDFNYLDTDTHVLSAILRSIYDKPYYEIVIEKLWERLGMAGSAFWSKNAPDGHTFGNACLCLRLIEFGHLGQLYLNDGVWDGKRLLPEGWVHECSTPRAPFQEPKPSNRGYGYHFWIPPDSKGEFMALGAFNQILWIDIERGVVVAQFSANEDQLDNPRSVMEPDAAMRAIVDAAVLK